MTGSHLAVLRVVTYAIVGGFVVAAPTLIANETFLAPRWDGGLDHLGNGLVSVLIGVTLGALGAVLGVLLARRQLRQIGVVVSDAPILSLPALGVLGAFVGSIVAGGLWGGLNAGAVLLGIGLLAAQ
ncbi:MAG: hypothetical protein QOH89_2949 [Pseudonocardiales bacterium]|nr:hypothetical protein [Pseudonocardiales bacterium]